MEGLTSSLGRSKIIRSCALLSLIIFTPATSFAQTTKKAGRLSSQGFYNFDKGRFHEAIEKWREMLRLDRTYVETHNNIGFAQYRLGNLEEAITEYLTALKIDPSYTPARNNLGLAYVRSGEFNKAHMSYQLALKYDPKNALVHYNIGCAYAVEEKTEPALLWLKRAFLLDRKFVALAKRQDDLLRIRKTKDFASLLAEFE